MLQICVLLKLEQILKKFLNLIKEVKSEIKNNVPFLMHDLPMNLSLHGYSIKKICKENAKPQMLDWGYYS